MHMSLKSAFTFWTTAAVAAMFAGTLTFVAVRQGGEGSAARAEIADATTAPNTTPAPGETPDTAKSFWYVPYLNADAQQAPFEGTLAGVLIAPYDDSVRPEDAGGCPPGTASLNVVADVSVNDRPLGVRLGARAETVHEVGTPDALECDGKLISVMEHFSVDAGAGGSGPGGGQLTIQRQAKATRFWLPQAAERWSEGTVAGRRAALLRPVIGTIGTSAVVIGTEGGGYTAVTGEGVTLDFLQQVAVEVVR
jgi:hypothetical protein